MTLCLALTERLALRRRTAKAQPSRIARHHGLGKRICLWPALP